MNRDRYKTAGELSMDLPFSEQYIRAAMNHPEFKTIGKHPAYSTTEIAIAFFENHPEFTIRTIYKRKSSSIRRL